MAGQRAVYRYAEALYEAAAAAGEQQRIGEDLVKLVDLWNSIPELSLFLTYPLVPARAKESLLEEALGQIMHPYIVNTLRLMARRGRASSLPEVRSAFLRAAEKHGSLVRALLRSARPVPPQEVELIKAQLGAATGRTIVLEVESAPDLLAGAELEMAGRRLDVSLRRRLARLAEELRG
ncbi:MAG: ATP synthase F1 subunit delta [Candidatus Bipolaricaulota bacterium]